MKTQLLTCVFGLLLMFQILSAQSGKVQRAFPPGAKIIELQRVARNRKLALWMLHPQRHSRDERDGYTCPEETRGSYYSGATRVSVLDTKRNKLLNMIQIRQEYYENEDTFDLPYRIHAGSFYHVSGVRKGREGKPTLMWLRDYNGDGKALEFALFDAVACMPLETTLIGYSVRRDRVIQYPIDVTEIQNNTREQKLWYWIDYMFALPPKRPSYWKYDIDYRGRGGSLAKHTMRYNKRREMFECEVVEIEP